MFISYRTFDRASDPSAIARPNSGNTLCIISLAIGGLTLLVAWIPYLGMLAVPLAFGGAVVAIVGIVIARAAGQRKVPWGAAGLLVCGVSIGVSYLSTAAWQNRNAAPGRASSPPPPPAIDMRHTAGKPFVPAPSVTRPVFVMPKIPRPDVSDQPPVERADEPAR